MRLFAAGLLLGSACVVSTVLEDMDIGSSFVKAVSAREIVLRELISNIQTSPEVIAFKVWEELDWECWLSVPEIARLRHEIARPFVQPIWFHTALIQFEGIRNIHNPEFIAYVESRGGAMAPRFKTREELLRSLYVWIVYCVAPLEIWNNWALQLGSSELLGHPPPCEVKEIVSPRTGQTKTAVVLSDEFRKEYLLEQLVAERQRESF